MKHVSDRFHLGVYYMLLSGLGLGFVGFFAKLGQEFFSVPALLFFRYFLALLPSLCAFLLLHEWKKANLRDILGKKIQILRVLFVLISQYSFFYYLNFSSLLNATLLLNTGPLFIPIIERIFLRQYVGVSTWVSIGVSFVGVLCILPPDRDFFTGYAALGMVAGLSQGISQVLFGMHLSRGKKNHDLLSFYFYASLLSLIPYLFLPEPTVVGKPLEGIAFLFLFCLAGASIFNQYFRARAFQESTPGRLASFLYISIVLAGVLDGIVFHKVPTLLTSLGACLILIGGILKIYLRAKILRKKETYDTPP